MDLDDLTGAGAVDLADALADVEGTAGQWRAAAAMPIPQVPLQGVEHVVVAGMGGSGITGDVLAAVAHGTLPIPVTVHRGYGLPAWVGPRALVVSVSYSGATEETLSAAQAAQARGCRGLAVSGDGPLRTLAGAAGWAQIPVPGGGQPRHSLGWLLVPLLRALGVDDGLAEAIAQLEVLAGRWGRRAPTATNLAKQLAVALSDPALPVVYATGAAQVAAYRLKCQLNENAKRPAWQHTVPELCHNEIVGWEGAGHLPGGAGLVLLRDPAGEHPRDALRMDAVADLLAGRVAWTTTVSASGESPLARLSSLLLCVDLASVYTALALDRDPTPIRSIRHLKRVLGTHEPVAAPRTDPSRAG